MDTKHLHSTRFLFTPLVAALILALAGCAGTPDETEVMDEPEVVETPAPVAEPEAVVLKPNYPQRYVVVKGDTLWDISARFLRDPWLWPKLWHFNPHIANPHLIYPGDILSIIFVNGQPMMQVTRNGKVINVPMDIPAEALQSNKEYPTVKLTPRIREGGLDQAIPAIPINVIGPFLSRPRVVSEGELEAAPYVFSHSDGHVMSGGGYKVYVRGLKETGLQDNYLLVRQGEVYHNPDDEGDILGYEAIYLGEAKLTAFGDPSTLQITDSSREVLRGARLLPKGDEMVHHTYVPRIPEQKVEAKIISVVDGVRMIGQYQVVVVNLGRQDDMVPGHVLAIYQAGEVERDQQTGERIKLPTERAGTAMIFRVFDRVSYALVLDSSRTIRLMDRVTNP